MPEAQITSSTYKIRFLSTPYFYKPNRASDDRKVVIGIYSIGVLRVGAPSSGNATDFRHVLCEFETRIMSKITRFAAHWTLATMQSIIMRHS